MRLTVPRRRLVSRRRVFDARGGRVVGLRRRDGVARERFIPFGRGFPTPERPYGITDRAVIEKIIERDAGKPLALDAHMPEV